MALSEVEHIKSKSNYLRGTLVESLHNEITGSLFMDDTQLIKFHGSYQQTDRDLDSERKRQKMEALFSFMIRIRVPGGVATPAQWLRMDDLSNTHGNGTIKLTTRQAFQLHGIAKKDLRDTIRGFNEVMLDSVAGCGDVNRNVMCSVNPFESRVHAEVQALSEEISRVFTPKTTAYWEIWLEGQPGATPNTDGTLPAESTLIAEGGPRLVAPDTVSRPTDSGSDDEPIYGPTYLPRKFKIALTVPPQNDTDVFANDVGLIAIEKDGKLLGFNVAAGGGLGMTFGMPDTFPRLGDVLGFVETRNVIKICEAVITTQRDHGNRENRKFSRLKYTVEKMGLENFKREVEKRAGVSFSPARPTRLEHSGDRYGWTLGHDDHYHLTLFIEGGRIVDLEQYKLKTALRELALVHEGDFRLTGNQNLVIGRIPPNKRDEVQEILKKYGVLQETFRHTALRRNSLACVALNTCTLAFAEAERYLPQLLDKLETVVRANGLERQAINIRMTGCPNGCARPYLGEIGLIGKSPGRYNLYLGASHNGDRLNKLYGETFDEETILKALTPIIEDYARSREDGESFGDFVIRKKYIRATTHGTNFHT
jgi:sulfite reductase (NADPH) hemoprotein beta-component